MIILLSSVLDSIILIILAPYLLFALFAPWIWGAIYVYTSLWGVSHETADKISSRVGSVVTIIVILLLLLASGC